MPINVRMTAKNMPRPYIVGWAKKIYSERIERHISVRPTESLLTVKNDDLSLLSAKYRL